MVQEIINNAVDKTQNTSFFSFKLSHILILVIFVIAILGLILWGLFKLLNYLKEKKNPLIQTYKEKTKLCKQHRNKLYYHSFFKPSKNAKIMGYYILNNKMYKTLIGYYYGHYITSTGDINILFARNNVKKWFILPSLKILMINLTSNKVLEMYNNKTKSFEKLKVTLPNKYIQFLEDEIALIGVSSIDVLDEDNLFYFPILHNKNDGVDNLRFYFHESIKEQVLSEQYINTLNFFINANKKIVDFNPFIKTKQKLGDNNSNLETQED